MENRPMILGFEQEWLQNHKAIHTATEIAGQPQLWRETFELIDSQKDQLAKFLNTATSHADLDIVLTGAGTSAFIGQTLESYFKQYTDKNTRAIATTDIVSHPGDYFSTKKPTLLISFARSGNSPESIGVVALADQLCKTVYHLIITCNKDGELANYRSSNARYTLILPPSSNDKGLAMTGSFTSMLLAGLLTARIKEIYTFRPVVETLSGVANYIFETFAHRLKEVAEKNFSRAIFLGSGSLAGIAQEGHLKLQELTDGKVMCSYDSYLGFRHGPKAVINPTSLLVYHFSNNPYVHHYEADLVKDIHERGDGMYKIGIGVTEQKTPSVDLFIDLPHNEEIDDTLLSLCSIIPDQILGFYKSIELGLNPDEPSMNGAISRVVQGVTIYPYHNQ